MTPTSSISYIPKFYVRKLTGLTVTLNWIPEDHWVITGHAQSRSTHTDEIYVCNTKTLEYLCLKTYPKTYTVVKDIPRMPVEEISKLARRARTENRDSYSSAMHNRGPLQEIAREKGLVKRKSTK